MPEPNTIEIGLILRDQATAELAAMAATTQAVTGQSQLMGAGLENASRRAVSFSRQVSTAATSARFLAVTVANQLSPALGQGAAQLTSLASVAALSGTVVGALATVGIGALVLALVNYIEETKKAAKAQEELNKAILEGDVLKLIQDMLALETKIEAARAKVDRFAALGKEAAFDHAEAQRELNALLKQKEKIETGAAAAGFRRLDIEEKVRKAKRDAAKEEADREEDIRVFSEAMDELAGVTKKVRDETLAFDEAVHKALLDFEELKSAARDKALEEAIKGVFRTAEQVQADLFRRQQEQLQQLRQALEGQQQAALEQLERIAKHGRDAGEQFSAGLQAGLMRAQEQMATFGENVQQVIQGTGQAWARTLDDVFFNVITGQVKKLEDVFKQFGASILRELTGAAARAATANLLRSFR